MKPYKHIFFDLDRTLWDFDANTRLTLSEIHAKFAPLSKIEDVEQFVVSFNYYNDRLWDSYRKGEINKGFLRKERFRLLLNYFGIQNQLLVEEVSRYYINNCPVKGALIPHSKEILEYLSSRYKLYIISNGFYDVQLTKLINSGISKYFSKVFTSDRIGHAKPHLKIFEYAIKSTNARKAECLMIGDDYNNDIGGAINAGIDQVFLHNETFNNSLPATYCITDLRQLLELL